MPQPPSVIESSQVRPLILTLQLDAPSQTFYDALRHRYFPPDRNSIAAHLTLFHQLPDQDLTYAVIREAAHKTNPFLLSRPSPRSIGKGVAIFFQSQPLATLHAALATAFAPHLIPQDRQRLQPHIVVQNKVRPEVARHTLPHLQAIQLPETQALGLSLFRYLGGPWQHLADFPFG